MKKVIDEAVLLWCQESVGASRPSAVSQEDWEAVRQTGRYLRQEEPDWQVEVSYGVDQPQDFVIPHNQPKLLRAYNAAFPPKDYLFPFPSLTLRKSDSLEDWYVITRGDGEDIGDASVEGTGEEMLAIADAIERRSGASFHRCAVDVDEEGAAFWSPRNSERSSECSLVEADTLAARIRKVVGE